MNNNTFVTLLTRLGRVSLQVRIVIGGYFRLFPIMDRLFIALEVQKMATTTMMIGLIIPGFTKHFLYTGAPCSKLSVCQHFKTQRSRARSDIFFMDSILFYLQFLS